MSQRAERLSFREGSGAEGFDDSRFLSCLERVEIPDVYPMGCRRKLGPLERAALEIHYHFAPDPVTLFQMQNTMRQKHGMFGIVTRQLCAELAEWIGDRKVLEIMAGCGWLAKGLSEAGVSVVATDSMKWFEYGAYSQWTNVHHVRKLGAISAVRRLGKKCDVLVLSWPHFQDKNHVRAIREWPAGKPVLYIGEGPGGCCAGDEFFDLVDFDCKRFEYHPFYGLHDWVMAGVRK